jgi:HEAT repeat protein
MRRIDVGVAIAVLSAMLVAGTARAQLSNSSSPYRTHDGSQDPADATVRHQKSTMGLTVEEWARHLEDADPATRLEAVGLLADSKDPKAIPHLIRAVEDADLRVSTAAVDALGKLRAKEASDMLSQRLVLAGVPPELRSHILVALGRIRDPASVHDVLAFAESGANADQRSMAIRLAGEIGDASAVPDLRRMSDAETDPNVKVLLQDAIARIESSGRPK